MKQNYNGSTWSIFAGLRFALATIVLVGHLQYFVTDSAPLSIGLILGGRAAVLGFLLISGVSIGYSYMQNAKGYYQRRFIRIYPLYFIALLLTFILIIAVGSPYKLPGLDLISAGWKTNLANLFFLQGFFSITTTYNIPLWTLAVEVFFYLIAPYLVRLRVELYIILIIISIITFSFYPRPWIFGYPALRYGWPWLIGFLSTTRHRPKTVNTFLVIGVFVTALNKTDTAEELSWLTFGLVAVSVILLNTYQISISKQLQKVLNYLGELSYPIYLFHFPLYLLLYRFLEVRSIWLFITLTFLITIIINYIADHWLKRVFWKPLVNSISRRLSLSFNE